MPRNVNYVLMRGALSLILSSISLPIRAVDVTGYQLNPGKSPSSLYALLLLWHGICSQITILLLPGTRTGAHCF